MVGRTKQANEETSHVIHRGWISPGEEALDIVKDAAIQRHEPGKVLVGNNLSFVHLDDDIERKSDEAAEDCERHSTNDGHSPQSFQGVRPPGQEQCNGEDTFSEGPENSRDPMT